MKDTALNLPVKTQSEFWKAIENRDNQYNGRFYYGVVSTRKLCLPSCSSRQPLRKNVRFFLSLEQGLAAGFEYCKRCKPKTLQADDSPLTSLLRVCRYINDKTDQNLKIEELARAVDLSQHQLHRLFKKYLALTPKKFIDQSKLSHLKKRLRDSESVTNAIFDAGFDSMSVIYGRLDSHLGMTPKAYRHGGQSIDISFAIGNTPLGKMAIGATDKGLCYLQFADTEIELLEQLTKEYPQASIEPMNKDGQQQFEQWMQLVNLYLQGANQQLDIPEDIQGTAFQKKVWDFLKQIPYGELMSYQEVAEAIGKPKATRAVASACARNQLGLLIPCHRVIRSNGELGGYRWGLSRKRSIIDLERRRRQESDK